MRPLYLGQSVQIRRSLRSLVAVLQSRNKFPPVYQGHIDTGTSSVRMMQTMKIAPGDGQKPSTFGQSE
jgi:hypothetical protein